MKAISLWQPWASAIAVGAKRYETRGWPAVAGGTLYSGWLAICASKRTKKPKEEGGAPLKDTFDKLISSSGHSFDLFMDAGFCQWETLPLGAVVAVGWLNRCHPTNVMIEDHTKAVSPEESVWGNYGPNRYAWEFSEVWRLNMPLPVRGEQKLFDVAMPANWQDQATKIF